MSIIYFSEKNIENQFGNYWGRVEGEGGQHPWVKPFEPLSKKKLFFFKGKNGRKKYESLREV